MLAWVSSRLSNDTVLPMTRRLAIGSWTQEAGQKGMDVRVASYLEPQQFDEFLAAISTYRSIVERPVYALLATGLQRLQSTQSMCSNVERLGGSFRALDSSLTLRIFLREVTTWLALTRLYLESERDSIASIFGAQSVQATRFVDVTHRVFDDSEGYRFLYNLRDYSQHCGPPLGGLTVSVAQDGSRVVELYLSRSELLLARFAWSKHSRLLLDQWDEQIHLVPLIKDAMRGFERIEDEVLAILIERCGEALPTLRDGISRAVAEGQGVPAIFELPTAGGGAMIWQSFPSIADLDKLQNAVEQTIQ